MKLKDIHRLVCVRVCARVCVCARVRARVCAVACKCKCKGTCACVRVVRESYRLGRWRTYTRKRCCARKPNIVF